MNEYEPTFCLTPRDGATEAAELVVVEGGSATAVEVVGTVVDVDVGLDVFDVLDFAGETVVEGCELAVGTEEVVDFDVEVEVLLVVEVEIVVHGGRLTSLL
jgi:hypothetical protein